MSFYVYLIHNIINNKVYVGKTKNLKKRWASHISLAKNKATNQYIHRAIRKYGVNNFIFSIIQVLNTEHEYNQAEMYWIKYFNSNNLNYGYNLTQGGDGSSGREQTKITRAKISKTKKGKMIGKDNPFYGKTHSEKTKNEISRKNTGLAKSDLFKEYKKISMSGANNHFYGKQHTTETIKKISGENSKSAKLTSEQVLEIISLFKSGQYTQKQIGIMYNISQQQISRIITGQRWKHK